MKIGFFEIEDWEIDYLKNQLTSAELFFTKEKLNKDNLPQERNFDINAFPNLKLIATRSTGFDHIDLKAAKEKNIPIAYVPGYGDNTVAEFAFGLILNLSRKIYTGFDQIRETGSFSLEGLRGFDLNNKKPSA